MYEEMSEKKGRCCGLTNVISRFDKNKLRPFLIYKYDKKGGQDDLNIFLNLLETSTKHNKL